MKWSGTDAEIRYRRIWRLVRSNINVEIAALRPIGLAGFIPYPVSTLTHENQMSPLILIFYGSVSRIAQSLPIEHSSDNNSIAIDPVFVLRKSYAFVRFHSIATGEDILGQCCGAPGNSQHPMLKSMVSTTTGRSMSTH